MTINCYTIPSGLQLTRINLILTPAFMTDDFRMKDYVICLTMSKTNVHHFSKDFVTKNLVRKHLTDQLNNDILYNIFRVSSPALEAYAR